MLKPLKILLLLCSICYLVDAQQTDCLTFNLENNFDETFHTDTECDGYGFGSWQLGEYQEIGFEPPHINSSRFMTPLPDGSCSTTVESVQFNTGGVFEASCYLNVPAGAEVAYANFLLHDKTNDAVLGFALLNSDENANGWHTLTINLIDDVEEGYILFVGAAPVGTVLIVDSFRYVRSENLFETCDVYEQSTDSDEDQGPEEELETEEHPNTEEQIESEEQSESEEQTETEEELGSETEEITESNEEVDSEEQVETEEQVNTEEQPDTEEQVNTEEEPDTEDLTESEEQSNSEEEIGNEDTDEERDTEEEVESPIVRPVESRPFWNALTITGITILSVLLILGVAVLFYELGQRRARKQATPLLYLEDAEPPKSILVPRVTNIYNYPNDYIKNDPGSFT